MYLQKVISRKTSLDPDPHKNVMDPEHCSIMRSFLEEEQPNFSKNHFCTVLIGSELSG
jgi:hypothetical protein